MTDRLIECVPNFSEGRKAESLRKLVAEVRAVPGIVVLDEEQDADHHRAVLTFVGSPSAVAEAAFQSVRTAVGLIDLRQHQGGHPRVGAADVVPFVPLRGVTMDDCIAVARQVGARIGRELGIPVFLYERAATWPERRGLENIRKGGLEGLAARMQQEAAWAPDFGPGRPHPTAGATVVGARPPLIAYNVNLASSDLAMAKAIAKTIRQSSGGLPSVKAIGVELSSRRLVQVSINLTNYEETPIHIAYEAVRKEAGRQGVEVLGSEIIGLVPQRALAQAAESYLKLEGFKADQVLEVRLERVLGEQGGEAAEPTGDQATASLSPFLEAVSAGTPTPGGGSVAALGAALACALGLMACRLGPPRSTASSPTSAGSTEAQDLQSIEQRLVVLRLKLQGLVQADAEAYNKVLQAYRLAKDDPQRPERISQGLQAATAVPLETAASALEAASLLQSLLARSKPAVATDLKVGIVMAAAAVEGAVLNAEVNIKSQLNQTLKDDAARAVGRLKESLVELRKLC